jgi:hypothetical protein
MAKYRGYSSRPRSSTAAQSCARSSGSSSRWPAERSSASASSTSSGSGASCYFAIVLLNTPESKTLPVGLLGFQGQYFTDIGVQSSGLVMATVPIVVVFLIFQKHITKGLTLGALK